MPQRAYLDASVLASFSVRATLSDRAEAIMARVAPFVASELYVLAVSGSFARRVRTLELHPEDAALAFERLDDWLASVPDRVAQTSQDWREATSLVRRPDLALRAQAAVHASIAMRLALPMATLDSKLAEAMMKLSAPVLTR